MRRPLPPVAVRGLLAPPLLAAALALLPTGCGERGRPALHQSLESQNAQAAYGRFARVLDDAISAQLGWLERDDRGVALIQLAGTSGERIDALPPGASPWHEAVVTLLVRPYDVSAFNDAVAPGGETETVEASLKQLAHRGVWLFDPRHERLVEIAAPGEATEFELVRALSTDPWLPKADDRLRIYHHRFAVDIDGAIRHLAGEAISDGPGDDLLPVAMPAHDAVVFQRELPDQSPRLVRLDLPTGVESDLVDPSAVAGARLPLHLDEDHVAIVGDLGDGPQLLSVDLRDGAVAVADPARLRFGMPGELMLMEPTEAGLRPVLRRVPRELDLGQITALARARSPGAARHRALMAAALAEARRETLALWPTLSGGIAYTPAVGLLTDPTGATSGDFLGENLVRLLAGLVQPLLNADKVGALEAAALERARIAADLAVAAGSDAAVAAASAALDLRRLDAQLTVATAAAAAAEVHARRLTQRRDGGEATEAEVLAAHAESVDATERRALLAKRADQRRDLLLRLLGLHPATTISLREPRVDLASLGAQPREHLQRLASLRQPRLRAAARGAEEAFLVAKADRRHAPQLTAGAFYGYSMDADDGFAAVDDYLTMSLIGTLPLAAGVEGSLVMQRADAVRAAREAALAEERRAVAAEVDERWLAVNQAAAERRAAEARLAAAEERLRVARLRAEEPVDAPEDPIPLEAIARGEREVAALRLAYLEQRGQAEAEAVRLLGLIGSDGLLDAEADMPQSLVRHRTYQRHLLSPPSAEAVRALGPGDPAVSRTLVLDVAQLLGGGLDPAGQELVRALAAAAPEDQILLLISDPELLQHLGRVLAGSSPLERGFDAALITEAPTAEPTPAAAAGDTHADLVPAVSPEHDPDAHQLP